MADTDLLNAMARVHRKVARAQRSSEQAAGELRVLMRQAHDAGHSYDVLAKRLGISRSRVQQIVEKARTDTAAEPSQ